MAFSLKDYEIIKEIGQGGFAQVFRARQKSLSREVAIKQLSPQRIQNAGEITRFRREAEAMALLTHDNIVSVFDYAFYNGNYYIVMEYVEGTAFDAALERGLPRECGLFVLEKTAGALKTAHSRNVIHRDIKPANILLGRNGQVKLTDFGLALFHTGIESLSSPGSVLGTISYMAPEALASPKEIDARVDVFSLGCILYQVIAGKHPFAGSTFGEISFRLLNEEPQPLTADNAPAALATLAMRCLRKNRDERPSMAEVHDTLAATTHDRHRDSQERLIAFVSNADGHGPLPGKQPPHSPAIPLATDNRYRRTKRTSVAAGVVALVVGLLFMYHQFFHPHRESEQTAARLPAMPAIKVADVSQYDMPESKKGKPATDAPRPLTGSAVDTKSGTLVLRGLGTYDTVLLNGKTVQPTIKGRDAAVELLPGYYRLDIRRSGRPPVVRELELVPFERQTVDLPQRKDDSP
jgi:eukaryotic-like serine/threonine-protein kinase